MKAGVAVVSSDLPPMTEVMEDAALYFDPYDPEDIAAKIARLLNDKDLLEKHKRRGKKRAEMFSPERLSSELMRNIKFAAREKILCLSSEYPPVTGGIATHLYNLWNNFPPEETLVLTSKIPGQSLKKEEKVKVLRRKYPMGSNIVSSILRVLFVAVLAAGESKLWKVKCIHCGQILSSGIAGLILKRVKGIPYVVYIYSADILEFSKNPITRFFVKKILEGSRKIIANSFFTRSIIVSRVMGVEDKIVVSTPVIDISEYSLELSKKEARMKLGVPIEKKIILTVARLSRRKGHDVMLKVLSMLVKERDDILYLIAGSGPMLYKLEEMVKKLSLVKYVKFCGRVPDNELRYYYRASDLFCMVPKYMDKEGDSEGFGIVFLEAAGWALPVIAGNSGGVKEAVVDGKTGILVDPLDEKMIKESILRLLEDEDLTRNLGNNGRKRLEREFDVNDRVRDLIFVSYKRGPGK